MKILFNPRSFRGFFRFSITRIFLVAVLSFTIHSCSKFDQIGLDLVENKIGLKTTDTLTIVAYTVLEDSVPTSSNNRQLLGFYNDPLFGKTRASIYTQTRLINIGSRIAPTFERDQILLDSVVLIMAYNGYFGDLTTLQNIHVYELNDTIPAGNMFSNKNISYIDDLLNYNDNTSYTFAPNDSLYIGRDSLKVIPQLRLKLKGEFGRRFVDAPETNYESVANFLDFFKGFYITAGEVSGPGALAYFNLGSNVSTFLIYYSIIGDTISRGSRIHEFPINEFARRFNNYENFDHEYTSDLIKAQVLDRDTLQGENLLFLQSMANYKVKLYLPHLQKLFKDQKDRLAINSARLILPIDTTLINDNLGYAQNLFLLREDSEGNIQTLRDNLISTSYFGGAYNKVKGEYVFNITQHVQSVINENIPNTPLYLLISASAENGGRTIISGTKADKPLRLEIKYTEPLQ